MADFDLILLGESYFTDMLRREFDGRLKILVINNSCLGGKFSADFFPRTCFIPQKTEHADVFGQITTGNFRMDLASDKDVFSLLFEEELRESEGFLKELFVSSSGQLNFANRFVIENFGNSLWRGISADLKEILKNLKNFMRLMNSGFGGGSDNFTSFMNGLSQFFAPGEINPAFYNKYLLYSLLSKKPCALDFIKPVHTRNFLYVEAEPLRSVRHDGNWSLQFPKKTVSGKILISAIPPHILSLCGVEHKFPADYDRCFYKVMFKEDVTPPVGMAEELVFMAGKTPCFIHRDEDGLSFFMPSGIGTPPPQESVSRVIGDLIPHVTRHDFEAVPHIFPFYGTKPKRKLRESGNVYFFKNIEYPYYGSDGEMLYQERIKEVIWKSFL